ncbi:transposase, partial [Microbacterium sp. MEC084]|uniref:IS3 family transposase n=1 Tax=Microbacterium sp. MEC084 TaxID=1963027 RepID=UPI001E5775BD
EGARPALTEMIRFIDEYRERFGVELICRTLRPAVQGFITSRGYRAAKTRVVSARQLRDELLVPEVARLHAENYGVYGRRKMHAVLKRQGWDIGRDQTERLMRLAGVRGVRKSKKAFTTRPDKAQSLPRDLVQRRFRADAPHRHDNALAEAINNLYKTELIRQRGPWRTVEQVELATLEWVWWWNHQRLHGELGMRTPAEVEDAYYADLGSASPATAGQGNR